MGKATCVTLLAVSSQAASPRRPPSPGFSTKLAALRASSLGEKADSASLLNYLQEVPPQELSPSEEAASWKPDPGSAQPICEHLQAKWGVRGVGVRLDPGEALALRPSRKVTVSPARQWCLGSWQEAGEEPPGMAGAAKRQNLHRTPAGALVTEHLQDPVGGSLPGQHLSPVCVSPDCACQ